MKCLVLCATPATLLTQAAAEREPPADTVLRIKQYARQLTFIRQQRESLLENMEVQGYDTATAAAVADLERARDSLEVSSCVQPRTYCSLGSNC